MRKNDTGIIRSKEFLVDYEAGSGIPGLGMKPYDRWLVIAEINGRFFQYDVDKNLYDQIDIGDHVEIGTDKFGMPDVILLNR